MTAAYVEISDYVEPAKVLKAIKTDASVRKAGASPDALTKAAIKHIRHAVATAAQNEMLGLLTPNIEMYMLVNGVGDIPAERDDWQSGLDDVVEAKLEPFIDFLSQNWLGEKTIDSGVWDDAGLRAFCKSFGSEIYKEAMHGKKPEEVLRAAGLEPEQVTNLQLKPPTKEERMSNSNSLEEIMCRAVAHAGGAENIDPAALELAIDDDLTVAQNGLNLLGLTVEDHAELSMATLMYGDGAIAHLQTLAAHAPPLATAAPATPVVENAAPAEASTPRAKTTEPNAPDAFPVEAATALKEHSAITDTNLATLAGCSRTTFTKVLKGKQSIELNDEQREAVRKQFVEDINGLLVGLGVLTSTDYSGYTLS